MNRKEKARQSKILQWFGSFWKMTESTRVQLTSLGDAETMLLDGKSSTAQVMSNGSKDGQMVKHLTTPQNDWANLTEVCLLRIFKWLPNADLSHAGLVCRHWGAVQKSAFKSKQELTVCYGDNAAHLLLSKPTFPSDDMDAFGRKVAFSRINLPNMKRKTIRRLLRAFPNVTNLCLSVSDIKSIQVRNLVVILNGMSSTLVKLQLCVRFNPDYSMTETKAGHAFELLKAINQLPHLKVLTVDLGASLIYFDHGVFIEKYKKEHIRMPILARLQEFNFCTYDDAIHLFKPLHKFAAANNKLHTVRLQNSIRGSPTWDMFLKLDRSVLSRFKHLKASVGQNRGAPPAHQFSLLFPLLTSLTYLDLYVENESAYIDIIRAVASLKQLEHLKLNINNGHFWLRRRELDEMPAELPQLTTVKQLTLNPFIDDHEEDLFGPFYIDWVFPQLQQLNVDFVICSCSECHYNIEVEDHDEDTSPILSFATAKNCASHLYEQVKELAIKQSDVTFEWHDYFSGKFWTPTELGIKI